MKTRCHHFPAIRTTAFTLIELIGVLAIMTILAGVLVPNVLQSVERAAVIAEVDTVHKLGEEAKIYLRDNAVQPTNANWNTVLAAYAWLSPTDILTNKRQMTRLYVTDPNTPFQRALLISSMRTGVALPSTATIQANFNGIWNWIWDPVSNPRPPGFAAAWTTNFSRDYLVIERINYIPVYRTDFPTFTVVLNNQSTTTTVSYQVVLASGTTQPSVNIVVGAAPVSISLGAKDQINLYKQAGAASLDYSYTGGSKNQTFYFTDVAGWLPQ